MTPNIEQIEDLPRVQFQGLVDLARFAEGLALGQEWGLINARGKADLDQCRRVLAAGQQRGIVPREPVVFTLDLIRAVMTNGDGSLPLQPLPIDRLKVDVDCIQLRKGEQEVPYYTYKILDPSGQPFAFLKCCRSGMELHFENGNVWRMDLVSGVNSFLQKMGA